MTEIEILNSKIVDCRKCERLVEWRERVAIEKRKSFAHEEYWGRPVPVFGDFDAEYLIVGLAPAAHGANRTGRMFTGDRSGDFLYASLFRAGVASQPESTFRGDGLALRNVLITATCHCAPPDNKPTPEEMAHCQTHLSAVLGLRPWKGVLCLGGIAWTAVQKQMNISRTPFGHGAICHPPEGPRIVGSYHPSQQNTFTGRLTPSMMDEVIRSWLHRV